ncbi:MAG TPA: sulfatase-like hydrolase/transferase [Labilithrix sp.]|nr:sulfatase-like hydrolase/transferase [Labilithrix sp.]
MASGLLSSITRSLGRAAASAPVLGAVYLVALSASCGSRSSGMDAEVGDVRRAEAVELFIARRFPAEVTRMKIGVVATAIAVGLVLGLVADVLCRLRAPPMNSSGRRSALAAVVESVLVVVCLHAALVAWAMADSPQLYASRWYAQGGAARTAQVIATDVLGPRGVVLVALLVAIAYVRPSRLVYLARSALLRARRALGSILARVGNAKIASMVAIAVAAASFADHSPRVGVAHAASDEAGGASSHAAVDASPTRPETKPVNVLILSADSLRADRLDTRRTPNLMKLAARGTRFDRAYVSLPRTFPSWVTILTGRHAHHHGIRSMFPTWEERAKDFDALPARFAKAGYATAVVSDYAGDIFTRTSAVGCFR